MRSILSFAALTSIVFSAAGPAFGQNSAKRPAQKAVEKIESKEVESRGGRAIPKPVRPQPSKLPEKTEFAKVEAMSDGKGAWIRWRMVTELKNAGFRVYRLDKTGEFPVSEFMPGSSFTTGERELTGGEYNYFDPKGNQDSAYFVEAISDSGKTLRTGYLVPEYVESIDAIPDGNRVKAEALAPKAGENLVSQDLQISSDLKTEIQSGLLAPNPTRHREVISTPGGVRIASKADGLIRVTKTELQGAGFDVNSNSANWQLYVDGNELPIIVGPNADHIEFLGKSVNTLETNFRTYYLIPGNSPGRRIASRVVRPTFSNVVSRKYNQTFVREDKKIYISQVLNGTAENWWGDPITSSNFDYKFNLSGIDRTAGTRKLTLLFQGYSVTQHSVELTLNGTVLPNLTGNARFPFEGNIDVPVSSLLDGQNTLRMRAAGPVGDISLLTRISIDFPRDYVAMDNKLEFYTDNYKNARVSGFSTQNIRVFDVTYEDTPRQLTNLNVVQTGGTWGPVIPAGRGQLLYAVEGGSFGTALSVTANDPTLLGEPSNAGQLLIISHPSLMASANAWASYRSGQGILTKVVDVTDIYDEFNSGVMSPGAIEDFLEYAKNNWQTPPSYVLLIGDGHYDSKNYDGADLGYWNMIPARLVDTLFMETGSDEALSDFNHDGLAEIPIGRIPARDAAFVTKALNKVVAWEASLNANSMNRGALFAHDWPDGYDFQAMSNRLASNLPGVPQLSISQTSPTAQADILSAINDTDGGTEQTPGPNAGVFLMNYSGHGTVSAWRNSGFFSAVQAPALTNANHPSLIIALTCLNGYFFANQPTNVSFAEAMTGGNTGGAVAVWASTGETTPDVQEIMSTRFYIKLKEGSIPRIGDLINDAKVEVPAGADVRLSWALIGDPMLKVR
ncbi:MAG: C25 family cysteine peptidase [Pyrinomonadaceae bacterium]